MTAAHDPAARVAELLRGVKPIDESGVSRIRRRLDGLTKPQGSLGRLEDLAVQLALIYGDPPPPLERRTILVLAADHGVSLRGVSAYPRSVTAQMCGNFDAGGAAVCVMARAVAADVRVVDVGVDADLTHLAGIHPRKVRRGSRDLSQEPALTETEVHEAILAGSDSLLDLDPLPDLFGLGEMGIGNTTAATALCSALTGCDPASVAGPGTGIDDVGIERKAQLVRRALSRVPANPTAIQALSEIGGLEIAGLAGVVLAAARARRAVVVDGFITAAAALAAARLCPPAAGYLVASHLSPEPGHAVLLGALGLEPFLRLDMRLGEGTGALLALPIVDAAARMLGMATFEEAGVATACAPGEGEL